ncbi:AAA family ATPase [Candidatus Desantisbacteria bacterium]|nr:AAA family ATPase [Candidatus Desantisbacteria bacterium]
MTKLEVLAEYGFKRDPFKALVMETADFTRVKRILSLAIESKAMISIIADRGFGKSDALELAIKDKDYSIVRVTPNDKEEIKVGDIEQEIILKLSQESVKRTRVIRTHQVRRLLGEESRQRPVIIIIEEAHRIKGQTLRSLKTMREMEWMGIRPLATIVMIGQYDPMRKRGVEEVDLRTDTFFMKGLTSHEIKKYIDTTVGNFFEPDAISAIAKLKEARNFLELQKILTSVMSYALEIGKKKVTTMEVFELYGGGLKELLKITNSTIGDISKETGLPRSTVSMNINNQQGTMSDKTFNNDRQTISDILKKKIEEKVA